VSEKDLKERTLTNLYNALNVWRGDPTPGPSPRAGRGVKRGKITDAAGDFAPRLAELHDRLDKAVCKAYGWPESVLADEEDILRRLLALNGERSRTPDAQASGKNKMPPEGGEGTEAAD
jgi:hypothetical protein